VVTPSFSHHKTLWMLRKACRGRAAAVSDVTTGLATLAVMGPRSRELLSRISPDDLSNAALPWMRGKEIEVGRGFARCLRVSFVGELGYELYPDASLAVDLYDQIVAAGPDLGLRHAGFHALDSLRSEKGYRHLGHDIGPAENPYQAGLGFTVSLNKPGGFVGRDAVAGLAREPLGRRQVFVKLSDPDANLIHGESIYTGGEIVGRLTNGAYGHTLGAAVGLAFLRDDVPTTEPFEVDCAGDCVPAALSDTPFYDPANTRLRG
jgi:4-methylaminobutanoate oxidase (formaldehyde-forming)